MRIRGTGRGVRTLSRFALIGLIGGGTAACSSDASRLGNPFTNPFSSLSGEPSATGSLPDGGETADAMPAAPAIRTPRVQTQSLGAPTAPAMSARPMALAPPTRVASTEPTGSVAGMNPDAGRAMTPRAVPAPQPKLSFTPAPKVDKAAEKAASAKREAEARKDAERKVAEARRAEAAAKAAEVKAAEAKLAETKKAEAKKLAEAEAKRHVRPGQAKAEPRTAAKAEPKPDPKAEAAARAKAEAKLAETRKAESEAKIAKADASRKVAEAKAAEAAAKAAAKQTKEAAKEAAKEPAREPEKPAAPVKVASVEPATTAAVAAPASTESFRWPAKGRVINGYGSSGNEGINIAVPEGTPVKAAEDGTVAYAGSDVKGYGKLVLVRHTNGYVSAYAHNGELDVRPGEKVKRGQTIAKSGATGNVTSPQLHFEIRKGATPVDPMPHLASN